MPEVSPFDPENKLVFMTGPLTGILVPCTGRYVVCAKSPLTNACGEAHSGGFWAREFKKAGYEGKSEKPVYLLINDEEVRIESANALWGMGCLETEAILSRALRRIYPQIMSFPTTQIYASYGTSGELLPFHDYGDVPIKNFTMG